MEQFYRLHICNERQWNKESNHTYIYLFFEGTDCPSSSIRTRKPGDRMRYKGLQERKKIKDILIDEKIPRHLREKYFL